MTGRGSSPSSAPIILRMKLLTAPTYSQIIILDKTFITKTRLNQYLFHFQNTNTKQFRS